MLLDAGYRESSILKNDWQALNTQHDNGNIHCLSSQRTLPELFFILRLLKIHSVN